MGLSDIPPPDAPRWLIPVQTGLLGVGISLWDMAYVLMVRRSLLTGFYAMPLLPLALNLGWELVFGLFVCETVLETIGICSWLVLDLGLVWTTLQYGPDEWRGVSPVVARHLGKLLIAMTAAAAVLQYALTTWWLAEPGRGTGNKTGKWWGGVEGKDTTELAFWLAAGAQLCLSVGLLAMLLSRGHLGGTSFAIW